MFEPRGHDMMSGAMIYPPKNHENDFSILFLETSGCLPMCGHGTIGVVTIAIEENIITPKIEGTLKIEVPAGTIEIKYDKKGDKVNWVEIKNVDSYLAESTIFTTTLSPSFAKPILVLGIKISVCIFLSSNIAKAKFLFI